MSEIDIADTKNDYNDENVPDIDIEIDNKEILEKVKEYLEDKNDMYDVKIEDKIEDKKDVILFKTFLQLFETFLTEDTSYLDKFNFKLTPEVKKYLLLLCKESPDLFSSFEETLKNIISDNRINLKDIPDILVLVTKVYKIIKENKNYPKVEPYELIKTILHLGFVVYIESQQIKNHELLSEVLKLIDSSIELIKLTPIFHKKKTCFNCLFSS